MDHGVVKQSKNSLKNTGCSHPKLTQGFPSILSEKNKILKLKFVNIMFYVKCNNITKRTEKPEY